MNALLAAKLALRDMRGGVRGMRIVIACLALGVAAIAGVGSLRAAMDRGLATEGARLLGGDIAIESGAEPLPDTLARWLAGQGARTSAIVVLRSLLVAPSGERLLVELKAVDSAYPLVGAATLTPPIPLQAALAGGLVADPLILKRLGLHFGDSVRLGNASFRLEAALDSEPDHAGGAGIMGPRAMIALSRLPATGLIQPGSLVTYEWRELLPAGADRAAFVAALQRAFPDTGWRIRNSGQADPGLQRAIDQTGVFLVLVGLSALLVGGIGVATGVRAWLERRARTMAILRCVGASAQLIFATFLIQVFALCAAGIVLGVVTGAALPAAAIALFGADLPVPAQLGVYPGPLGLAALYGALTAAVFALMPLGRAARIPGAALFRDAFVPVGRGSPAVVSVNAGIAALLAAAIVFTSQDRAFAAGFCASALAMLLVFYGGARLVMEAARRAAFVRPVWLRLGVANLYRPAAATPLLVVALGLGLTSLATVALIEGNIRAQFAGTLTADAPSFFFIDIQNDQLDRFAAIVHATPGVSDLHQVPSLRARLVALNGVPVERAHVSPDSRWALRGDRGLTYSATVPEGSHVVAGHWWPANYDGPPLLSLDEGLAHGWGLHVGDTLQANVLGRNLSFRIANLRAIDWRALRINFTLVASPGLLEHAPHMHIATVRTTPSADAPLLRAVTDALPNVTGIRVADIFAAIAEVVGKLATALAAAGSITLVAGVLVLAGAVAAGQRRRISEAVVLKTLGGTRAQIRAAWLVEFGLIGACAGVIAASLGTLASWAMMRFVLRAPWVFLPGTLAVTIGGCMLLMLLCGYAGTERALRTRVAPLLRTP
jgi:putative ABC transport system permease protein